MQRLPTKTDDDDLGPAMLALSVQRRKFVAGLVFEGLNQSEAAKAAGYSTSTPSVLGAQSSRMARAPEIQAAIEECSRQLWKMEGPRCIRRLVALSKQEEDLKVALRSTESLLDRMGMAAITQSEVRVTHELSEKELDRRIAQFGKELGWNDDMIRLALMDKSNASEVIEAEFTEVEPTDDDYEVGRDGLEEIL